jgi:hypothetical protein
MDREQFTDARQAVATDVLLAQRVVITHHRSPSKKSSLSTVLAMPAWVVPAVQVQPAQKLRLAIAAPAKQVEDVHQPC